MSFMKLFGRLLLAVSIALGLVLTGAAANARPPYRTTEVAPGLYSFGAGLAFNAFMVTDDGAVVMDSFDKDFAKASLEAILHADSGQREASAV